MSFLNANGRTSYDPRLSLDRIGRRLNDHPSYTNWGTDFALPLK